MPRELLPSERAALDVIRDLEAAGIAATPTPLRRGLKEKGFHMTINGVRDLRRRLERGGIVTLAIPLPNVQTGKSRGLGEADHGAMLANAAAVRLEMLSEAERSLQKRRELWFLNKISKKSCNSKKTLYHGLCSRRLDSMTGREISDILRTHKRLFEGQSV